MGTPYYISKISVRNFINKLTLIYFFKNTINVIHLK
jgi:hypothetical protein